MNRILRLVALTIAVGCLAGVASTSHAWAYEAPAVDVYTEQFNGELGASQPVVLDSTNSTTATDWYMDESRLMYHGLSPSVAWFYGRPTEIRAGCVGIVPPGTPSSQDGGLCNISVYTRAEASTQADWTPFGGDENKHWHTSAMQCNSTAPSEVNLSNQAGMVFSLVRVGGCDWSLVIDGFPDEFGEEPPDGWTPPGGDTQDRGFGWFGIGCDMTAGGSFQAIAEITGAGCFIDSIEGMGAEWVGTSDEWLIEPAGLADERSCYPGGSYYLDDGDEVPLPECEVPEGFPVPRLSCGRTLQDMGNGQWFAHTEAVVRNPTELAIDEDGYWFPSWAPEEHYESPEAIIPLPPDATSDMELYVSYVMRRVATVTSPGMLWTLGEEVAAEGRWVESDPLIRMPAPLEWILRLGASTRTGPVTNGEQAVPGGVLGSGGSFEYEVGDGVRPTVGLNTEVEVVRALCTIRVSPVLDVDDPDVIVVIPPFGGEPPDDEPPPPGSEGEDEACADGAWYNPLTWAKSIWCAIKGLGGLAFDGLIALLNAIWDWVKDLLDFDIPLPSLPELVDEWEGKFPLSLVTEANQAATAVDDVLAEGLAASCGPTFDPNLDALIDIPGGGPGSEAGLDDVRGSLPSPSASCDQPSFAQDAADLGGLRSPIRAFLTVLLYAAFIMKVITSIGPGRSGIEPA